MEEHKYKIVIIAKNEDNAYWSMVKALRVANVKFKGIEIIKEE